MRWVIESIDAGILSILAESEAFDGMNEEIIQDIGSVLHPFFTQHLVHYSVVRAAENAMYLMSSEKIEQLGSSRFADTWIVFRSLLVERKLFMSRLARKIPSPERTLHCESVGHHSHINLLEEISYF